MELLTKKETIINRQLEALGGPRLESYKAMLSRIDSQAGLLLDSYYQQLLKTYSSKLDKKLTAFKNKLKREIGKLKRVSRNVDAKEISERSLTLAKAPTSVMFDLDENPFKELEKIAAAIKAFKPGLMPFSLTELKKLEPNIPLHRFRYELQKAINGGKLIIVEKGGSGQGNRTLYGFPGSAKIQRTVKIDGSEQSFSQINSRWVLRDKLGVFIREATQKESDRMDEIIVKTTHKTTSNSPLIK